MIPKKLYYSISEVCSYTELEPHVLRYWESEFSQLKPKKNRAGNRAYREKDIDLIKYIKHLLYEEKFTIPGAKKKLNETRNFTIIDSDNSTPSEPVSSPSLVDNVPSGVFTNEKSTNASAVIDEVKSELRDILAFLSTDK